MSIFISIASYQDPLLVSTIFSAYKNAQNKDQLIFSVCDQSDDGIKVEEIGFRNQIHYEHVDPLFSKGPWLKDRGQTLDQAIVEAETLLAENNNEEDVEILEKLLDHYREKKSNYS